ncbi:hypothetical protein OROMI_010315 [Orobanche minor]
MEIRRPPSPSPPILLSTVSSLIFSCSRSSMPRAAHDRESSSVIDSALRLSCICANASALHQKPTTPAERESSIVKSSRGVTVWTYMLAIFC